MSTIMRNKQDDVCEDAPHVTPRSRDSQVPQMVQGKAGSTERPAGVWLALGHLLSSNHKRQEERVPQDVSADSVAKPP